MDAIRTGAVLTKLAAVFIVVFALRDLSQFVFYYATDTAPYPLLISAIGLQFLLPVIVASFLWTFPNLVVGSMATSAVEDSSTGNTADELLLIGVSLLGLYTTVFGFIDLLYFEAHRYAQREMAEAANMTFYGDSPDNVAGRITNLAQIVAGVILIFGRRNISTFLLKVRSAGTRAD